MAKPSKEGGRGKNSLKSKAARKVVRNAVKEKAKKTLPYCGLVSQRKTVLNNLKYMEKIQNVQKTSEV